MWKGGKEMSDNFITAIKIGNEEILNKLSIELSSTEKKNLIITGKNGSGKTTLLKYIRDYLKVKLDIADEGNTKFATDRDIKSMFSEFPDDEIIDGNIIKVNNSKAASELYQSGKFIVCFLESLRTPKFEVVDGVEQIILKNKYNFKDEPYRKLLKYMVHLKTQQAYAKIESNEEIDRNLEKWFTHFNKTLKKIWDCETLKLIYDHRRYDFKFREEGKKDFNFFQLSDGYSSILTIFADIMMRMERNWLTDTNHISTYDLHGIVIIDEIETHLHIALQKKILPSLIEIFPNIQFIVSTHSPYILNSVDNAVIYDMEHNIRYDDFSMYSISEISEAYFSAEEFSQYVKKTVDEYKELLGKQDASNNEKAKRARLRHKLNSLPRNIREEIFEEFDKIEQRG